MKKQKGSSKLTNNPESLLDEAGDESFPASDPLAWNGAGHLPLSQNKNQRDQVAHLLANDHELIKKVVQAIAILIKNINNINNINLAALQELTHFFQHFVEKIHHQKEALLYKLLNNSHEKNQISNYVVNDLLHEHQFSHELLTRLENFSVNDEKNTKKNIEKIIVLLNDMHHFYLTHVQKEEEYILPNIHNALDESSQQEILSKFKKIDESLNLEKYKLLLELAEETV